MRVAPLLLATSMSVLAYPVQAEEKVLSPSSDWQFSITEREQIDDTRHVFKECSVVRQFGEGRDIVVLEISNLRGAFFHLQLAGHPLADLPNQRLTAQFGPHEGLIERGAAFGRSDRGEPMLLFSAMTLAPAAAADALDGRERHAKVDSKRQAAIEWLRLEANDYSVRLQTGDLFGAFAALESCIEAVRRPGEPRPIASKSKASPPVPASFEGHWLFGGDVGKTIAVQPIAGVATVRLAVDRDGRVAGCEVIRTTKGYKTLGIEACRTISERAIFFPARDDNGNPIEGEYESSVKYWNPR